MLYYYSLAYYIIIKLFKKLLKNYLSRLISILDYKYKITCLNSFVFVLYLYTFTFVFIIFEIFFALSYKVS